MRKVFFILLIPFLFFSCGYVDESKSSKWLFAVYMMGDNNLSDAATSDLQEMMNVGSDDNVRIVVLCDRGEGTTLYEVKKNFLEPVETFGNLDTGDSKTLKLFIDSIKNNYTFENLALIFWDHGDGWYSGGIDESANDDYLLMREIYDVLNETSTKPDLLGFDECLSGMVEVVYDFKDLTKIMVASENFEPGDGWDYYGAISKFKDSGNFTYDNFAKSIVDSYYEFYSANPSLKGSLNVVLSAISMEKFKDLFAKLDNLTVYYYSDIQAFKDAREDSFEVYGYYVDFYSFIDSLEQYTVDSELKNLAREIIDILENSIYVRADRPLNFKGLSIYFPDSQFYLDSGYFDKELNMFVNTKWDDFLERYLGVSLN